MPFEPRVRYGFEHKTMEAKIRWSLHFTPGERFEMMMAAIELTLRVLHRTRIKSYSPEIAFL